MLATGDNAVMIATTMCSECGLARKPSQARVGSSTWSGQLDMEWAARPWGGMAVMALELRRMTRPAIAVAGCAASECGSA
jgi:hypothetical protein